MKIENQLSIFIFHFFFEIEHRFSFFHFSIFRKNELIYMHSLSVAYFLMKFKSRSSKMTANTVELAQNRPLQIFLSPKEVYFALLQSKVHRPG